MTTSKETIVFIDGEYLSIIAKYFNHAANPHRIDLNQFAITLAKANGLWCKKVYYYTAPPYQSSSPTPEEIQKRKNYDSFANKLRRIPNFNLREGRCQKIEGSDGKEDKYQQKAVDTLVVMDLALEGAKKKVINVIVVACDTDFVPILNQLKDEYDVNVILAYYTDKVRGSIFSMSNHILTACNLKFALTQDHFDRSRYI